MVLSPRLHFWGPLLLLVLGYGAFLVSLLPQPGPGVLPTTPQLPQGAAPATCCLLPVGSPQASLSLPLPPQQLGWPQSPPGQGRGARHGAGASLSELWVRHSRESAGAGRRPGPSCPCPSPCRRPRRGRSLPGPPVLWGGCSWILWDGSSSFFRGCAKPGAGPSSASIPPAALCGPNGVPEPPGAGLRMNGGCGRGCTEPPWGCCCWLGGDKGRRDGAGRQPAANRAAAPVPGHGPASRRGRWARGERPWGAGWAWGRRGDAVPHSASRGRNSGGPVGRVGVKPKPAPMLPGFAGGRCGFPLALGSPPRVLGSGLGVAGGAQPLTLSSPLLSSPPAGAYYPAQGVQQFPAGVPTAQVIVSQQPPIPPKRERKTVRGQRGDVGRGRCRRCRAGGARCRGPVPGGSAGAGDLGRPGGRRCAESRLPGGRGCRGCQLLSAPGDAGARRPCAGPIYSGEASGRPPGPVVQAWGGGGSRGWCRARGC